MNATPGELIGSFVRRQRLDAQVTQVVFAERCGFHQEYLSRLERGMANPSLNALVVVAAAFGMSVFDLFEAARHQDGRPASKALTRTAKPRPRRR